MVMVTDNTCPADADPRPTRVKVGPVDYTIEWHDVSWLDRYERRGDCSGARCVIGIAGGMPDYHVAAVFLHEVIHAMHDVSPIHGDMTGEQCADLVGYGLVAFWRDNPQALAWWAGLVGGVGAGKGAAPCA